MSIQAKSMEIYKNPPTEFHPVPWWAWTGKMEKAEMKRQLGLMCEQGIYEFYIFPLYGLEYPVFLQDSWWEYITFTIEECEKRDMKVWIYDDLNWPSGSAGGWAVKEHPEYRMWMLQCRKIPLAKGENYYNEPSEEIVLSEFRDETGGIFNIRQKENYEWQNPTGKNGTLVLIVKIPHEITLLNCNGTPSSWGQRGALDLLNADAVKTWMSYIHEKYWKNFKKYFGKTLKGFFFDEPHAHRYNGASLPWTKTLFKDFKGKYGYDLIPNLPKLFFNDKNSAKVRFDFWTLITEYFSLNFSRQLADWGSERAVAITGHGMLEEMCFQKAMLAVNSDIQQFLRYLQIPGCDLLGARTSYFNDPESLLYGNDLKAMRNLILTAKRVSSTARYSGAQRIMCEAFGV
ncbi:MAG: glycosyl hydrolase, partial [Victivallaceae bacterium]|nr:glycosyl hydrolase [Victivallaceae bacterium]